MNGRQTPPADDSRIDSPSGAQDADQWLEDHGDVLFRYARSRVRNRDIAEDLVQDTFVAALQSHDRFQNRATVRTWLLSILRNKIVDHYRRAATRPFAGGEPIAEPDPVRNRFFTETGVWKTKRVTPKSPDQIFDDLEFRETLDRCLGRLPRALAAPFILRELEQVDNASLSQILGLTESNLRVRLHRARLLLRACLEKYWLDLPSHTSKRTS